MQSRCLLQLLLALSSLILSKAQDVIGPGPCCFRSSPADYGLTRVTFLRQDTAGVRSLYLTLWSEDARPVACEVNSNPLATARYRDLCDKSGSQDQEITQRFNISVFLAPDAPCALVSSSAPEFTRRIRRDGTEGKTRRKRSWFFPGTLWCGTGSQAARYEQLGMFESADRCCREHDHCLHIIPAFTVNYGVFNPKFFTVSHCDCDQRFRQCLLDVNDSISHMVGYSFFSILQVPCFELQQQKRCTEMHWWGMCKASKEAPYAVFKHPLPFNATARSKHENSSKLASSEEQHNATESPVINPHTESPKSEHNCSARGDTFHGNKTKGKGCKTHQKLHTVAPSQVPSISRAYNTTPSMETRLLDASENNTNENRAGKKKNNRKGLPAYPTQTSQFPPQVTTNVYSQTTSTTLKPTTITKSSKKDPNQSPCCGFKTPLRGDTFQPHCKSCLRQNTTSRVTTATPSTTTYGLPIRGTTLEMLRHIKTTPKPDTWSTADPATPTTTKTTTSVQTTGKPQKHTNREPAGRTKAPNTHAERGLKLNFALHNMTDNQLLCGSLKHLDACKYKISPLEKKYDLQNTEAKTAYHCDCTSRTAVQIKSFKRPSILPTLLTDFVSPYCFKLPKEKGCYRRKSCSGGFTKAYDLLRALKKIEEKDTAGKSGNGRKRGIPVRLYKRCLRLEREADIMAQLT